jgi:hypothetical protein
MKDTDSTLAQFDQAGAERLEKIYLTPQFITMIHLVEVILTASCVEDSIMH